jgi:TonB family protein
MPKLALSAALLISIACPALAAGAQSPDCRYPALERRLGIEGTVTLGLTIGTDGSVKDAQVVKSSGNGELDRVSVNCVKAHWHYKPGMKDGVPIESQTEANMVWKLPE